MALARSRGSTKRKSNILVGDTVEYELVKDSDPVITAIMERKTSLHRPPVANVDLLVLTVAAKHPDPNTALIDKMIALAEAADIDPILCINKTDLSGAMALSLCELYRKAGYSVFMTSTVTGEGIEDLKQALHGHIIAFSGPSGAGKSSLLNCILGKDYFIHQEISRKLSRGKNTTRHAELVSVGHNSWLMDTPGYTSLDLENLDEEGLDYLFRDFRPYLGHCRFNNCRHHKEPGCAVREAVERGDIASSRYESYLDLLKQAHENANTY